MKNKELCKKCKYRGTIGNRDSSIDSLVCDYAATAKNGTCLKNYKGESIDRRGNDPDNCLLFEEGKSLTRERKTEYVTIKRRGEGVDSKRCKELPAKD